MAASKPRVLILGGLGFVGKNLVEYILQNDLASKVRVVDKKLISMANLSKKEEDLFAKVECLQANLCDPDSAKRTFTDESGDYDFVINLAAVTKRSQTDEVYESGVKILSTVVGNEALQHKTQKFIEVSTTEVYKPSSKPVDESAEVKPWTGYGKAKLEAENHLRGLKGLPLIIARLPVVYGPGDVAGLVAITMCIAAVYSKTGQKLEYPSWVEDQKVSTVHVDDAVRGLWQLCLSGVVGSVYNIADKNDTDQKKLNVLYEKVFDIKTGALNFAYSEASKLLSADQLAEEVNNEVGMKWLNMLKEAKIEYSPLSPFMYQEALSNNSMSVDGSSIEKIGFTYNHPTVTEEALRAQLAQYRELQWFP